MIYFLNAVAVLTVLLTAWIWFRFWKGTLVPKSPGYSMALYMLTGIAWAIGVSMLDGPSRVSAIIYTIGFPASPILGWYSYRIWKWIARRQLLNEIRTGT